MKRIIYLSMILTILFAGVVYSQSLAEIREKAKAEVQREIGIDQRQEPIQQKQQKSNSIISPELTMLQKVALVGIIIAFIPATIAKLKGRSFIAWWVLGLIAFIIVFPISVYMRKIPRPEKATSNR